MVRTFAPNVSCIAPWNLDKVCPLFAVTAQTGGADQLQRAHNPANHSAGRPRRCKNCIEGDRILEPNHLVCGRYPCILLLASLLAERARYCGT